MANSMEKGSTSVEIQIAIVILAVTFIMMAGFLSHSMKGILSSGIRNSYIYQAKQNIDNAMVDPFSAGEVDPFSAGEVDPKSLGEADPLSAGEDLSLTLNSNENFPLTLNFSSPITVNGKIITVQIKYINSYEAKKRVTIKGFVPESSP